MLPQLATSLLASSRPLLGIASSSRPLIGVSSVAFVSSGLVQHCGAVLGLVGSRLYANEARPASTGAPADEMMSSVAGMGPTAMDATAHMVNSSPAGASAGSSRYLDPDSAPRHAAKAEPQTVNDHTANLNNTHTSTTKAAQDAATFTPDTGKRIVDPAISGSRTIDSSDNPATLAKDAVKDFTSKPRSGGATPAGTRSYITHTAPMTTSAVAAAIAARPASAMSSSAVLGMGTVRALSTSTAAAYGVHIVEDASAKTSKVLTSEDVGGTASQKFQEVAGQSGGHGYRSTVPSDLQGWATIMGEGLGMVGAASLKPFKFTAMATATLSRRMIDALTYKGVVGYGLNHDNPKPQYIPTAPWPAAYVNPGKGSSSTPWAGDSQLVNSSAGAAYGVLMQPAGGKRSLFGSSGGGARGYSTPANDGGMHAVGDVARAAMHSVEETTKSAVRNVEDMMLNPSAAAASVTHSVEGAMKSVGTVAGVITDMPSVDKPIVQDIAADAGRATRNVGSGRTSSASAATSGHSRGYSSSSATVGDRVMDTAQSVADSAKHAMSVAKDTAKSAGERTAEALGLTDAAMGVSLKKNDEGSGLTMGSPKGSTKADSPTAVPAGVDKIGGDHPNIPQISTLGSTAKAPRKYSTSAAASGSRQSSGACSEHPVTTGRSLVGSGIGSSFLSAFGDSRRSYSNSAGSGSADKVDEKNIYEKARKEDLSGFNVEDRAKRNAKAVGNTILHPFDTLKKAAEQTASRTTEALAHADAEGLGPTTARDGKEADSFAGGKGSSNGSK